MLENKEDAGANPGEEQNSQPADDNNSDDQGNEDILKSFYQLPDDVRSAINMLPDEQRVQTIKAFDDHRASQETGFNDKLQKGRQAEDNLTALLRDPNIDSYLRTGGMSNQQESNQQLNQEQPQRRNFSKYGEGAEDFAKDLVAEIADTINVGGIRDEVAGIRNVFAQNQQQTSWQALEEYTKENNLPDPNNYASNISMMVKNQGLTVDEAYRVALGSDGLVNLRQPVNQIQRQAGEQEQIGQSVNSVPGGNRGSGSPRSVTEQDDDPVEVALKARLAGKPLSIGGMFKEKISAVLAKYNEDHGTNLTEGDLP